MRRLALAGVALASLIPALPQAASAPAELTSEARSRIDAAIDRAITEQRIVGAVVLVSHDGKPRARESSVTQAADGTWVAKLKSPPVDGGANKELIALVAGKFGCGKAAVSIKTGAAGRIKLVRISA